MDFQFIKQEVMTSPSEPRAGSVIDFIRDFSFELLLKKWECKTCKLASSIAQWGLGNKVSNYLLLQLGYAVCNTVLVFTSANNSLCKGVIDT